MSNALSLPLAVTHEVRDACLCLATQRAARAIARRFDAVFRPLALTNGQFSLLMALNRPNPPTMGEVAALLALDRTTLTAALKSLERRGLVSVAADAKDRRARRLSLTVAGSELLVGALPLWRAAHAAIENALGTGVPDGLRGALGRLAHAADADAADAMPPTSEPRPPLGAIV